MIWEEVILGYVVVDGGLCDFQEEAARVENVIDAIGSFVSKEGEFWFGWVEVRSKECVVCR